MTTKFSTGIEVLLGERLALLRGRRVGLVTHPAALTSSGQWSAEWLWEHPEVDLACLWGPEHGVYGHAGAGEPVAQAVHPGWEIPVYSLYGETRKPTPEMLEEVDVVVVDLQDLGVRCYTYVSTLHLVIEAAAESGTSVIVADRPIPFPGVVDGPMPDPALRSFVAHVPFPFVYGMTQGESARYLQRASDRSCDVQVVPMRGYRREPVRRPDWPAWVPPSAGIRSWESAWCYPATVFCEALPSLDCDRPGILPFQVLRAPWIDGPELVRALDEQRLPGVRFFAHTYVRDGGHVGVGIRLVVSDPSAFQPVTTGLTIIETLQRLYGPARLWDAEGARPAFFDQLCGTDSVRDGLRRGIAVCDMSRRWREDMQSFLEVRSECMLYP